MLRCWRNQRQHFSLCSHINAELQAVNVKAADTVVHVFGVIEPGIELVARVQPTVPLIR